MIRVLLAILILLLLLLQYQLWVGAGSLPNAWQLEAELKEQKLENENLRERNHQLEAEVQDLKAGLEAIEERARSELGMVKEDETFYQVVNEPEDVEGEVTRDEDQE